jgi:hypothetical protein
MSRDPDTKPQPKQSGETWDESGGAAIDEDDGIPGSEPPPEDQQPPKNPAQS